MSQINKRIILCSAFIFIIISSCKKEDYEETVAKSISVRHRLTGREYLKANEHEDPNYGLFSYVLFSSRPIPGNRDRYKAVLRAYLNIEEIGRFVEAGVEPNELNITYLPVEVSPPENPSVDWLLEKYSYWRAQMILNVIEGVDGDGPYIVSYDEPLSGIPAIDSKRLLFQDLSAVPPGLVFLWVKEFIAQARQPRYWDERAFRNFMLRLRTNIAILAKAYHITLEAHEDVDSFIKGNIKIPE